MRSRRATRTSRHGDATQERYQGVLAQLDAKMEQYQDEIQPLLNYARRAPPAEAQRALAEVERLRARIQLLKGRYEAVARAKRESRERQETWWR